MHRLHDGITIVGDQHNRAFFNGPKRTIDVIAARSGPDDVLTQECVAAESEEDGWLYARLSALDHAYQRIPGDPQQLAVLRHRIARRRWHLPRAVGSLLLPSSVQQRAQILADLSPSRVWLHGDVNGVSVALAACDANVAVTVTDLSLYHAGWLAFEAETAGVAHRLSLHLNTDTAMAANTSPTLHAAESYDVSMFELSSAHHVQTLLNRACVHTVVNGFVMVSVPVFWSHLFQAYARRAGWQQHRLYGNVDHVVLIGDQMAGDPNDVVVLQRTAHTTSCQTPFADPWPNGFYVVDSLDVARLAVPEAISQSFFNTLTLLAPRPIHAHVENVLDDRLALGCWVDSQGICVTLRCAPEEAYAFLTVSPYDPWVAGAALGACCIALGSGSTRIRATRLVDTLSDTDIAGADHAAD